MSILKKFNDFIKERFGSYTPIPFDSPKINQFSQGTPNGMAGTRNPNSKTIAPDDQKEVGYKRFIRDFENNNKTGNKLIDGERPKRRWRKRREQKRAMKLNELFEPREIDYIIIEYNISYKTRDSIRLNYLVDIEGIKYRFIIFIEDEYLTIEFFKNNTEGMYYDQLTGHNNMLKILNVVGDVFEDFKSKFNNTYFITDFIISPSKLDIEKEDSSEETKRGRIYKYWLESKLKGKYSSFHSDKNEMIYSFNPAIDVKNINLL